MVYFSNASSFGSAAEMFEKFKKTFGEALENLVENIRRGLTSDVNEATMGDAEYLLAFDEVQYRHELRPRCSLLSCLIVRLHGISSLDLLKIEGSRLLFGRWWSQLRKLSRPR